MDPTTKKLILTTVNDCSKRLKRVFVHFCNMHPKVSIPQKMG